MKKASSQKNLEGYRPAFFLFGLILSLFIVLVVMEYRVDNPMAANIINSDDTGLIDASFPPRTLPPDLPPPPENAPEIPDNTVNPNLDKIQIVLNTGADIGLYSVDQLQTIEPVDLLIAPDIVVYSMDLDRMAIYKGCEILDDEKERRECFMQKISQAVLSNLEISDLDRQFGVSGRMSVEFVIGMDGKVRDVEVYRAPTANIETQVRDIVTNLPEFLPGMKDGRTRSSRMVLPIRLQLN